MVDYFGPCEEARGVYYVNYAHFLFVEECGEFSEGVSL